MLYGILVLLVGLLGYVAALGYAAPFFWAKRYERSLGEALWPALGLGTLTGLVWVGWLYTAGLLGDLNPGRLPWAAVGLQEGLKAAAFLGLWYPRVRAHLQDLFDGFTHTVLIGLGVAGVAAGVQAGMWFAASAGGAWRPIPLFPLLLTYNAALATPFLGLAVVIARERQSPLAPTLLAGFLLNLGVHLAYRAALNLTWLPPLLALLGLYALPGVAFWALLRERGILQRYLAEEVQRGLISPEHVRTACSPYRQLQAVRRARRWGRVGFTLRFYRALARLAFLKARGNSTSPAHLRELQREVARLAPKVEIG